MAEANGPAGYIVPAGASAPGAGRDVKATRASTGGALTVIESDTVGGAPWHVHEHEDEAMYVMEGRISVDCGNAHYEAGRHAFVFLPKGVPHAWDVSSGTATVLIISVPAGLDEFLADFHDAKGPDRAEVGTKHGITMLPGPPT